MPFCHRLVLSTCRRGVSRPPNVRLHRHSQGEGNGRVVRRLHAAVGALLTHHCIAQLPLQQSPKSPKSPRLHGRETGSDWAHAVRPSCRFYRAVGTMKDSHTGPVALPHDLGWGTCRVCEAREGSITARRWVGRGCSASRAGGARLTPGPKREPPAAWVLLGVVLIRGSTLGFGIEISTTRFTQGRAAMLKATARYAVTASPPGVVLSCSAARASKPPTCLDGRAAPFSSESRCPQRLDKPDGQSRAEPSRHDRPRHE